ncbi:MAG TPA: ferritin-like domain-containing protein [Planctomycetaceae bacterium]|nr:ferritin-like domain-containing protein [Planctomycetaceae bacterium]HBL42821.1 ferritin-like domain-containing protein [Planctomycetaceae bacterium]
MKTLADAFHDELQDVLSAEKQLTKALPKMVKKASSEKLAQALEEHLEQTREHVERVEKAFEETGKAARAKKCEAMAGLIEEAESMMSEEADPDVMDALIIALAQKVEHYEIATYGTLCTWAAKLKYTSAKEQLGQNLDDEEKADKNLTKLSKAINTAAKA